MATPSARAASTCTPPVSRRSAPRSTSTHGYLVAEAPDGLTGADIRLDFPSVGATENVLTASVLARGTTTIDNVAKEPEIVDIAEMLVSMGARIEGAGTSRHRRARRRPARTRRAHSVVPDRIAAGTWAFAAATTRGDVEVVGGVADHLRTPLAALEAAGCRVEVTDRGFRVAADRRPLAFDVATLPYPGFPTDLQPFALTYNVVADGSAMVTENLFEARFRTVQELARLGADAQIDGHHVMTHGVPLLSGAPVESSDIRSGAALVIAGLVAEGETLVSGVHHIDRGYPRFEQAMRALGADITREPDDTWFE